MGMSLVCCGEGALVLSYSVGPKDRILIIRPVSNCLYWLSHLAATRGDVLEDLSTTVRENLRVRQCGCMS